MRYHNGLYLKYLNESARDDSGDFIGQSEDYSFLCYCRDESNTSGRKVSNGESAQIEYSFMVYAPLNCPDLATGDQIVVRGKEGATRLWGTVIRFSRDRYNCRIWV